jgi:N-acetylneuraminic acid mutarotase
MGEGATCDLFTLDINTATWSAAQLDPDNATTGTPAAPPARSYHAMAAAGGQLYVFGGCGAAGRLADLWRYDPAAGAWLQLPGCASVGARGGSVMVASGDGSQLFVMGGFNGDGELNK